MLDKKIANIISRIICTSESSQEFKNDDRVSVIDLFDVYKSRAKKANEFYNSKLNEK